MSQPTLAEQLVHWRTWIGRTEQRGDLVTAAPLAGAGGHARPRRPRAAARQPTCRRCGTGCTSCRWRGASEIGADGHPQRGGFLPPVPLPRRMWAGGRLDFHHPLQVGDEITRRSRIARCRRQARAQRPAGVRDRAARDQQRARRGRRPKNTTSSTATRPRPARRRRAPQAGAGRRQRSRARSCPTRCCCSATARSPSTATASTTTARYVTEVEGYPGLIVHGPLIATLLVDLLRRERPQARLKRFAFTALRPVFDIHRFQRLRPRRWQRHLRAVGARPRRLAGDAGRSPNRLNRPLTDP